MPSFVRVSKNTFGSVAKEILAAPALHDLTSIISKFNSPSQRSSPINFVPRSKGVVSMIDSGLKLPLSKAAATVNGLKVEPGS